MSELGDYKRAQAAAAKAGWERILREWRCPDCGMGVTKVHVTTEGLQGCGKPPGYWTGRKGCEHDETLMGGECGCDERPRFVATNGDTIELTDEQAAYVARVLAPTEEAEKDTRIARWLRRTRAIRAAAIVHVGWGRDRRTGGKLSPAEHWEQRGGDEADCNKAAIRTTTGIIEAYEAVMNKQETSP